MFRFCVVVQLIETLKHASGMTVRTRERTIQRPFRFTLGPQGLNKLGLYIDSSRVHLPRALTVCIGADVAMCSEYMSTVVGG
jgi:hypothetical protein